mmetsp:Transcript_6817/g.16757  ORF Transcript_6817/g.16757 Transcript_6817/m.16757 type:complete len:216 (+) Transcript_6817:1142-1789(+)
MSCSRCVWTVSYSWTRTSWCGRTSGSYGRWICRATPTASSPSATAPTRTLSPTGPSPEPTTTPSATGSGSRGSGRATWAALRTISPPCLSWILGSSGASPWGTRCGARTRAWAAGRTPSLTWTRTCRTTCRCMSPSFRSPKSGSGARAGARMRSSRWQRPSICAKTRRPRSPRWKWPSGSSPSGRTTTRTGRRWLALGSGVVKNWSCDQPGWWCL